MSDAIAQAGKVRQGVERLRAGFEVRRWWQYGWVTLLAAALLVKGELKKKKYIVVKKGWR